MLQCDFLDSFPPILSLIVEVYLWWKLQASLIFLSGRTCTIGGWLNTFLPHCICHYLTLIPASFCPHVLKHHIATKLSVQFSSDMCKYYWSVSPSTLMTIIYNIEINNFTLKLIVKQANVIRLQNKCVCHSHTSIACYNSHVFCSSLYFRKPAVKYMV